MGNLMHIIKIYTESGNCYAYSRIYKEFFKRY